MAYSYNYRFCRTLWRILSGAWQLQVILGEGSCFALVLRLERSVHLLAKSCSTSKLQQVHWYGKGS